jgi:hypothetical protein
VHDSTESTLCQVLLLEITLPYLAVDKLTILIEFIK